MECNEKKELFDGETMRFQWWSKPPGVGFIVVIVIIFFIIHIFISFIIILL